MFEDFEHKLECFNKNPSQETLDNCFESAFVCLSEVLEHLQFEFDTLDEMFRAAVMAQIISDEDIWIKLYKKEFDESNIYNYNNYLLLLLNNLKSI